MDEPQTSPRAPLRVVATGVDASLEALLAEAARRVSATFAAAPSEAAVQRQIEDEAADLIIVGDAPPGSGAEAIATAERLGQVVAAPVPVLLLARSDVGAADASRLAGRGIDALGAAALDVEVLARRFALEAEARGREERRRRAWALPHVQEALIAGLLHDLRTPLMAINLSAEVASARSAEDAVQQAMRRIRSSTQRMARSLEHLSNVARLDAQATRGPREVADLGQLARAALEAVRRDHAGADVDVVEQGDLRLRANPAALHQVLAHLLATAVAHAQGERVGVRVDGSAQDRLWFEVTTPRAIPAEVHERLFGPTGARAGREPAPLGLGLHAIEAIVRAHAGSIVARSKPSEGTVFELLLPREAGGWHSH